MDEHDQRHSSNEIQMIPKSNICNIEFLTNPKHNLVTLDNIGKITTASTENLAIQQLN